MTFKLVMKSLRRMLSTHACYKSGPFVFKVGLCCTLISSVQPSFQILLRCSRRFPPSLFIVCLLYV